MPDTDCYEFLKSNMPQDMMRKMPFNNYNYNFINDINSGIYSSNSSLVQFDLSSLYTSSKFTNPSSHYLLIPIVRCAEAFTNANASVPLTEFNYYLTTMKNLNTCLIHQAELQLSGKTVNQMIPLTNLITGVKLLSELSDDDLTLMGATLGILDVDNQNSMTYQPVGSVVAGYSSPGIANNYVRGNHMINVTTITTAQNAGTSNGSLQQKLPLNRVTTAGAGSTRNNFIVISNPGNLANEFASTYEVITAGGRTYGVWKDYAVIFVKDILDSMANIGLVRKLDGILRLFLNTGALSVDYPAADRMSFTPVNSTFNDTCPITVNNIDLLPAANVAKLTVGCFIARAPSSIILNGCTSDWSGALSSMTACRYYYNQIQLQPSLALDYISSNSSKTVLYNSYLYNTFSGISSGASFSQLVQSGVTNIKSIILIPLIASSVSGFSAYKSPFDTCGGASFHPISLTNVQVAIGGTNQLSTSMYYTYENYIQEIAKFNKQSCSEYGTESGLISREFWNNNRVYICNIRSTEDDLNTPRNVTISFNNNSLLSIDVICYVQYEDKFIINVSTGMITK
jgi:hypothetical protein